MSARVSAVHHVREYVLDVWFMDGSHGQIDFRKWIVGRGGVFALLEDIEVFKQVQVDPEAGTLRWPNDVDFCPDVLHHEATGAPLPGLPLASDRHVS